MNDDIKKLMEALSSHAPALEKGMKQMAEGFQEKQKDLVITAQSGANDVKISLNGVPEIISVELSENFSTYGRAEQEVLIKACLENCFSRLKESLQSMMTP